MVSKLWLLKTVTHTVTVWKQNEQTTYDKTGTRSDWLPNLQFMSYSGQKGEFRVTCRPTSRSVYETREEISDRLARVDDKMPIPKYGRRLFSDYCTANMTMKLKYCLICIFVTYLLYVHGPHSSLTMMICFTPTACLSMSTFLKI